MARQKIHLVQFSGAVIRIPRCRLLIVGLAPGLQGANRTGRPFTGDYAGVLLYDTLGKYGFARGEYRGASRRRAELVDCRITNAVRCVPPKQADAGRDRNLP